MADEEEVVVSVEQDPSLPPEVVVETADSPPAPAPDPAQDLQAQLAEFQEQQKSREQELADVRGREAQARAQADAAQREVSQARSDMVTAQDERLNSDLAASEGEATSGEGEYASAMEKGDFAAAAKAQRKIAGAEARIVRLNEAKAWVEQQKKAPPPRQNQQDPVEQYISSATPASQNWMRAHTDWIRDPNKYEQVKRAHYHAIGEGLTADSPDYFAHVETRLGLRQADNKARDAQGRFMAEQQNNQSAPQQQRRPSGPPPAPVGNGGSISGNGGGSTTVRLTSVEAKAATDGTLVWGKHDLAAGRIKDAKLIGTPIGQTEFAKRKLTMQRDGRYDRT